jgi:hypothetical protein
LFVVGTLLCLLFLLGIVYDDRRTDARRDNGSFGADLILFQTARADMGPKVPITSNMITCVRGASRCYNEELEKEKKAVEKNKKDAEEGIEAAKKRKAEEDSKKVWQEKKDDLETEIKSSKEFIGKQEMLRKDATDKALKMTNTANMKSSMMTAKFAAEAADERGKILNSKQAELALHMGKKPRGPGGGAK